MDKFFNSIKFKELLKKYEEAIKNNFNCFLDADEFTDIAEYYYINGKEDECYEAINHALSIFPDSTSALIFSARLALFAENDIEKAEQIANKINDEEDIEFKFLITELYLVKNQPQKAYEYIKKQVVNINDDDIDEFIIVAANMLLDYNFIDYTEKWLNNFNIKENNSYKELQGKILIAKEKYREGEKIFNKLLDYNPYSTEYWNWLTDIQFLKEDFKKALNCSEFAIAIEPDNEEAIQNKAHALFYIGNNKEALKYFVKYKKITKNKENISNTYIKIAHIYLTINNKKEALKNYKEAVKTSTNQYTTFIHIAISLLDNGYTKFAYKLFKVNIKYMVNDEYFGYAYFARCCFELNKIDEYNDALDIAIKMNPKECIDALKDIYPENTQIEDYKKIKPIKNENISHNNSDIIIL